MKPIIALILYVCPLVAQQWNTPGVQPPDPLEVPRYETVYMMSLVSLTGAAAADMSTSWGRVELNPVLTPGSTQGRFGWQAAAIKLGVTATSLLIQRRMIRHRPELKKTFAVTNFITAGAMSAVAVRNASVGGPRGR